MAETERIGQQVGDYRLLRWLGGGGFGEVYLGEHLRTRKQVAVKVLQTHLGNSVELKKFINEARTFRLKHPHIVPLLDFGIGSNDAPYLVMEYAPHGTLRDRHPRGTQVPLSLILSYVIPLASALHYAHNLQLVHRDVKPENMLLGAHDELLLSDFGIATVAHNSHSPNVHEAAGGTVSYMAPEQIQGKARPASDQYALGIVVYEWICGSCPFTGSFVEIAMQHSQAPVPSLCEQVPGLPRDVEQVVLTALAKDPKARFATVQAFANALSQAMGSVLTEAVGSHLNATDSGHMKTFSVPDPLPPVERRLSRRAVAMGLAGLTAVGIAGGGLFWLKYSQERSSSTAVPTPTPNPSQVALTRSKNDYDKNVATNGMMFGFDANHTRNNPYETLLNIDNVANLRLAWKTHTRGRVSATPIVANGVVYVGCEDSYLYAFDAANGTQLWTAQMGGKVSSAAIAPPHGIVYVGSDDGKLYAFDTTTGGASRTPLWVAQTGGALTSPTVVDTTVYVASFTQGDNNVYAFDARTGGSPLWTAHTGGAIFGSPAVFNKVVYVGSRDGKLYALDARAGTTNWTFPTGAGIDASPAVAPNGVVFICSRDSYMYAIDATTGVPLWQKPFDYTLPNSSAAVANEMVYVGSRSGYLYAFDANNGYVMWRELTSPNGGGDNGIEASPMVANGVVYVASDDGNVYAFNAYGGPPLWKTFVSSF